MSYSVPIRVGRAWRSVAAQGLAALLTAILFIMLALLVVLVTWNLTPHPATDEQHLPAQPIPAPAQP